MRVAVQHRLCSFDPMSPGQTSFAHIQYEICRLSALLYSDLVLFPIPDHSSIKPSLLYELGRILDKLESEIEAAGTVLPHTGRELLAWCVMLGAAASTSDAVFRDQYRKRLEHCIGHDARLRDWDYYKALVRRYLWWGYLLDSVAGEAFNGIS